MGRQIGLANMLKLSPPNDTFNVKSNFLDLLNKTVPKGKKAKIAQKSKLVVVYPEHVEL